MASVRNALFLLAFVVVVGGVDSAAFQQSDYNNHRSSVWSAKMSAIDVLSLWKDRDNENKAGVNGVKGCCMPAVLTTKIYEKITIEGKSGKKIFFPEVIFYRDQANKRVARDSIENNVAVSDILLCDKSGATLYTFWRATKSCAKMRLSGCPLDPDQLCFSSNGTLEGSFSLGVPPEALAVQAWGYLSVGPQIVEALRVVLSPDNCVPVVSARQSRSVSSVDAYTAELLYTNTTLSISDPSVFVPPPYCDQAEDGETSAPFDRPEFGFNALFKRFAPFRR